MSEAEEKFRAVVEQALCDTGVTGHVIEDYVDSIVGSLKLDDWFIRDGHIQEIQETDWLDYGDDWTLYNVWVTREEEDE